MAERPATLLQSRQGNCPVVLVRDVVGRAPVRIRSVKEVDEVDAEGLLCLARLPVLEPA